MIELSGREIVGAARITERQATEFKKLVAAVDACGDAQVRLNLTDLDATNLWKRESDYYSFIARPNLTVIVDPETAATIRSYAQLTNTKINFEVRELDVVPDVEDPSIAIYGQQYADMAKPMEVYTFPDGRMLKECLVVNVIDFDMEILSSIGLSGLYVERAFELAARRTASENRKLVVDFTGVEFEGGCDEVLAQALVRCKREHKGLSVHVVGEERGIDEYVRVNGRVKLSQRLKLPYFNMLRPGTVMRLNTYPTTARADIAGRKGGGRISGVVLVIFRGMGGMDALYDEIPTHQLYLPQDLEVLGEVDQMGDKKIPRKRDIKDLGIYGVCSGAQAHLGPVDRKEKYNVNDGNGSVTEIPEHVFVARGLDYLGIPYDKELLAMGRLLPPPVKR